MRTKPDCTPKPKPPCCSKLKTIIVGAAMSLLIFAISVYFDLY